MYSSTITTTTMVVVVIVELYMVDHTCEVCKYMGGWSWFAVQICANYCKIH